MSEFRVALTFDAEHPDRPTSPGVQERLLDLLDRQSILATFFLQGRWVEAYPDTAARIPEAGHLVGNHSFYHARMPLLTRSGFEIDLRSSEAVIRDYVGVDPRPWFRLPFGEGWDDARLLHRAELLGYRHVGWDVDVQEWRPEATAKEVEEAIVAGTLAAGDRAVILLHTWPRPTLSVENVITRLRDGGATFVRLDELPNPPAGLPLEPDEIGSPSESPSSTGTIVASAER